MMQYLTIFNILDKGLTSHHNKHWKEDEVDLCLPMVLEP